MMIDIWQRKQWIFKALVVVLGFSTVIGLNALDHRAERADKTADLASLLCVDSLITNVEARASKISDGTITSAQLVASHRSYARKARYCALPVAYRLPPELYRHTKVINTQFGPEPLSN